MLILSRRENESVTIFPNDLPSDMTVGELFANGKIEIQVREIHGNQVRLSFSAPPLLTILRTEVENQAIPAPGLRGTPE